MRYLFILVVINIRSISTSTCIFSDNSGDYYFDLSSLNQDNYLKINETSSLIFNICSALLVHYQIQHSTNSHLLRSLTQTLTPIGDARSPLKDISMNPQSPQNFDSNEWLSQKKQNTWKSRSLQAERVQDYNLSNMIIWKRSDNKFFEINRYQKDLYQNLQLVRPNKPLQGLVLNYKDIILNTDLTFYLNCDQQHNLNLVNFFDQSQQKRFILSVGTTAACPIIVTSKLWSFFSDLSAVFGMLMLVFGGFLLFLGYKLIKITFFLSGYMIGFCLLTILLGVLVLDANSDVAVIVSLFVITTLFSLLVGYICVVQPVVGFFCVGACFGIVLSLLFQNCFLFYISSEPEFLPLLLTMIIMIMVFGISSRKFPELITIASTSLVGSYCLVRPISWQGSNFPNEVTVSKLMKYGFINGMPVNYYFYLLVIIVLTVLGIAIQYSLYFRKEQIEEMFEPMYGGYQEMESFNRKDGRAKTMMFNEYGLEEYPQTDQSFRSRGESLTRRATQRQPTNFLRQLKNTPTSIFAQPKKEVKFQFIPETSGQDIPLLSSNSNNINNNNNNGRKLFTQVSFSERRIDHSGE